MEREKEKGGRGGREGGRGGGRERGEREEGERRGWVHLVMIIRIHPALLCMGRLVTGRGEGVMRFS